MPVTTRPLVSPPVAPSIHEEDPRFPPVSSFPPPPPLPPNRPKRTNSLPPVRGVFKEREQLDELIMKTEAQSKIYDEPEEEILDERDGGECGAKIPVFLYKMNYRSY